MLQGARHEHAEALYNAAMELSVDIDVIPLRSEINNHDLKLDGLVLPGGESTTMRKASENHGLLSSIFTFIDNNPSIPILGTCAGAILLMDPKMGKESYVDAKVDRNAYGRQKESFQAKLTVSGLNIPPIINQGIVISNLVEGDHKPLAINRKFESIDEDFFPGIFIRAPKFTHIGINVKKVVMNGEETVGLMKENMLLLSFHPELTTDYRFHRWLIFKAKGNK